MANTDKQYYVNLVNQPGANIPHIVADNFRDLVRVYLDEAPITALQSQGRALTDWLIDRLAKEVQ